MASTKDSADQSSETGEQLIFEFITDSKLSVTPCSRCGRPITTLRTDKHIMSEYMDAQGRCWHCAKGS